jgi:hypothetical protein
VNHTTNPQADNYRSRFDVAEALEAAGWIADDENPLEILRKGPAVWAITNDCGDSQLGADGWDVDFPSDVPNAVVLAACHTAVSPSVVVSADRATLRDRIADTVMPFLLNFSDEESARINAAEVATALLAVLPAPAPVCICGHPQQQHFEDACITEITGCNCGDYLEPQDAAEVIDRWRQAALHARAADRATLLHEAADAVFALDYDELRASDTLDSHRQAWELGTIDAVNLLRRMASGGAAPHGLAAATCSAEYHGHGEPPRLCIRAAQHTGKAHTDENGIHWSDTVAVYPVADGTWRVGTDVRALLRRVAAEEQPAETQDTLPAWLAQRFDPRGADWDGMSDDDRSYWEHQARAVRRAVERGGFKPTAEQPDTQTREAGPCDGCGHPEHPARECSITAYGQRCACDEPVAAP